MWKANWVFAYMTSRTTRKGTCRKTLNVYVSAVCTQLTQCDI